MTVAEALRKLGWRVKHLEGMEHWEHPSQPEVYWTEGAATRQAMLDVVALLEGGVFELGAGER